MNEATVRALAAINCAFYRDHADEFSAARAAPWPGWEPLLPELQAVARRAPAQTGSLRVLDVGCGHGRFARYLAEALPGVAIDFHGVDASEALLAAARRAGPPFARWELADFVAAPDALPAGPFDLVALIAVIHGVPGREQRLALLAACARRLAPGGLLVFTTWRAAADERLRGRLLDWNSYSRRAPVPIDCSQLDPGDHLIPWGDGDDVVRYFHDFDETELASCIQGLPLAVHQRYRADGRSGEQNEYFVFHRR